MDERAADATPARAAAGKAGRRNGAVARRDAARRDAARRDAARRDAAEHEAGGSEAGGPAAGEALRYLEDVALLMESEGLPRMAGRIFGWLLICDPPEQPAGELARVLQASKGSISAMTQLLIRAGFVERCALPGDRRDYYRMRPGAMGELMRAAMAQIGAMRRLGERGLALLADRPPALRERAQDFYDVCVFFEREYPALLARWEAQRETGTRATGGTSGQIPDPLLPRSA